MSIHNARIFVEKLRDDHDFRKKALATSGPEDLSVFLNAEGLTFDQTLQLFNAQYSPIYVSDIQWYPDSYHLILTTDQGINIMEYDTTNNVTIYSGPFDQSFVYPWPNGSSIITLIQFSPDTPTNLYSIKLK